MKTGGVALLQIFILIMGLSGASSALAQARKTAAERKFISINLCTDQLLLALADPEQIMGLSPYARDKLRSGHAESATNFPVLSGTAEEVIVTRPDMVLSGRFGNRATREMIEAQNIPVAEFDFVRSVSESKEQIIRMGELAGHPDRAANLVARIDTSLAKAQKTAANRHLRVLPLQRRGWVAGSDTLMTSLLDTVGLINAGAEIAGKDGTIASLESIVALKPDAILASGQDSTAEDQGSAFVLHPALRNSLSRDRILILPEHLTICGGPSVADALDILSRDIARMGLN